MATTPAPAPTPAPTPAPNSSAPTEPFTQQRGEVCYPRPQDAAQSWFAGIAEAVGVVSVK